MSANRVYEISATAVVADSATTNAGTENVNTTKQTGNAHLETGDRPRATVPPVTVNGNLQTEVQLTENLYSSNHCNIKPVNQGDNSNGYKTNHQQSRHNYNHRNNHHNRYNYYDDHRSKRTDWNNDNRRERNTDYSNRNHSSYYSKDRRRDNRYSYQRKHYNRYTSPLRELERSKSESRRHSTRSPYDKERDNSQPTNETNKQTRNKNDSKSDKSRAINQGESSKELGETSTETAKQKNNLKESDPIINSKEDTTSTKKNKKKKNLSKSNDLINTADGDKLLETTTEVVEQSKEINLGEHDTLARNATNTYPRIQVKPLAALLRAEILALTLENSDIEAEHFEETTTTTSTTPTKSGAENINRLSIKPRIVKRQRQTSSGSTTSNSHAQSAESSIGVELASMDKADLKYIINNSNTKYDEALKIQARKRLHEELRKQLKAIQLEKPKETIVTDLVHDGFVDAIKLPDVLLLEIEKAFGINIRSSSDTEAVVVEQAAELTASNLTEANLQIAENNEEVLVSKVPETNQALSQEDELDNMDLMSRLKTAEEIKIMAARRRSIEQSPKIQQSPRDKSECETPKRVSPKSSKAKATKKSATKVVKPEKEKPNKKPLKKHKDKGTAGHEQHKKSETSKEITQTIDKTNENATVPIKAEPMEATTTNSTAENSKTKSKKKKKSKKNPIVVIDSSSTSTTDASSSDNDSDSDDDNDNATYSDTSSKSSVCSSESTKRRRKQKLKYDTQNVVDSFEKLILPHVSEKLTQRYQTKYSKSLQTKLQFISCICTSKYNSQKFSKTDIAKIQKNLESHYNRNGIEFLMREIVNVCNYQKQVMRQKQHEDKTLLLANDKNKSTNGLVSTGNTNNNSSNKSKNEAETSAEGRLLECAGKSADAAKTLLSAETLQKLRRLFHDKRKEVNEQKQMQSTAPSTSTSTTSIEHQTICAQRVVNSMESAGTAYNAADEQQQQKSTTNSISNKNSNVPTQSNGIEIQSISNDVRIVESNNDNVNIVVDDDDDDDDVVEVPLLNAQTNQFTTTTQTQYEISAQANNLTTSSSAPTFFNNNMSSLNFNPMLPTLNTLTNLSGLNTLLNSPQPGYNLTELDALCYNNTTNEAFALKLRDLNAQIIELQKRKTIINDMLMQMQKNKMDTDLLIMKLQNEKFLLLNTAMNSNVQNAQNVQNVQNVTRNATMSPLSNASSAGGLSGLSVDPPPLLSIFKKEKIETTVQSLQNVPTTTTMPIKLSPAPSQEDNVLNVELVPLEKEVLPKKFRKIAKPIVKRVRFVVSKRDKKLPKRLQKTITKPLKIAESTEVSQSAPTSSTESIKEQTVNSSETNETEAVDLTVNTRERNNSLNLQQNPVSGPTLLASPSLSPVHISNETKANPIEDEPTKSELSTNNSVIATEIIHEINSSDSEDTQSSIKESINQTDAQVIADQPKINSESSEIKTLDLTKSSNVSETKATTKPSTVKKKSSKSTELPKVSHAVKSTVTSNPTTESKLVDESKSAETIQAQTNSVPANNSKSSSESTAQVEAMARKKSPTAPKSNLESKSSKLLDLSISNKSKARNEPNESKSTTKLNKSKTSADSKEESKVKKTTTETKASLTNKPTKKSKIVSDKTSKKDAPASSKTKHTPSASVKTVDKPTTKPTETATVTPNLIATSQIVEPNKSVDLPSSMITMEKEKEASARQVSSENLANTTPTKAIKQNDSSKNTPVKANKNTCLKRGNNTQSCSVAVKRLKVQTPTLESNATTAITIKTTTTTAATTITTTATTTATTTTAPSTTASPKVSDKDCNKKPIPTKTPTLKPPTVPTNTTETKIEPIMLMKAFNPAPIVNMQSGRLLGINSPITQIRIFENLIITSAENGDLYKFCALTLKLIQSIIHHSEAITNMFIDYDKCELYTTSLDGFMKKTCLKNMERLLQTLYFREPLQSIDIQWGMAYIGSRWGNVFTYNITTNKVIDAPLCSTGQSIIALKTTQKGTCKILILASKGNSIHMHNAESGLLLQTLDVSHNLNVYSLLLDHKYIYCGTQKNKLHKFDLETGQCIGTLPCGNGAVSMMLYRERYLLTGCYDGFIYVLDKEKRTQLGRFPGSGRLVLALIIVGDKIVTSAKDNTLEIINIPQYLFSQNET